MASFTSVVEDDKSDSSTSTSTPVSEETVIHPKLESNKKGFFDLPPELRNQIYAIILIRPRKLNLIGMYPGYAHLNNTVIHTRILRTCKRIHQEATPILYGANTFLVRTDGTSWWFLNMIGRSSEHINHLENTWEAEVQLEIWKEVLAVREYLIPETKIVSFPFAERLARTVQNSRRTQPPSPHRSGSPWNDVTLMSVKTVATELERHCHTKEGKRRVLKLLFPMIDIRAIEEETQTEKPSKHLQRCRASPMARDNLPILWLLATYAGFIIALTLMLGAPAFDPRKADQYRKSLFDLPAEIRNRIYEFALTRPRNLRLRHSRYTDGRFGMRLNNTRVFPSILATCKTANREATPILYGANKFTFDSPTDATFFLAQFVHSIDLIQQLEILPGFADEIVAGDYSAYIPAFKFAILLNPGVVDFEDHVRVWETAMAFQELFEEKGNRDFGKKDIWTRVEPRLDQRPYLAPGTKSRIQKLLA
ncbi:hypothetical protein PRZ48_011593 [Zasmidium cellare]|uniref:2EXR domain-containing protein n=1 Tax=Zasmidium cellare TaxID=395010 RepID=A0ABR0E7S6_ZASCE|nr:hypothetical protein PRZ48_011593 [Zasmidium cellare]